MLKRIDVSGFQALDKVSVQLGEGVNVLVGPSDIGKSSLMRAVRAATQQVEGTAFLRNGAKKALVKLTTDDGHVVEWHKGKRVNRFELDGEKFPKPGRGVPEPVADALKMSPARFGETCECLLQFSAQGEPAFMVANPPAELARIIGGVSGAAVLADAVREAAKGTTALARDVKATERSVESARERCSAFDGLAEDVKKQDALEATYAEIELRMSRLSRAQELCERMEQHKTKVSVCSCVVRRERSRADALEDVAELLDRCRKLERAGSVVRNAKQCAVAFASAKSVYQSARSKAGALRSATDVCESVERLVRAEQVSYEYTRLVSAYQQHESSLETLRRGVTSLACVGEVRGRLSKLSAARVRLAEYKTKMADVDSANVRLRGARAALEDVKEEWEEFTRQNPQCPLCGADMEG